MLVTLFVDASYYEETKSGAWAFYAISQHDKLTYAGRFVRSVRNSSQAELAAIANALHIVLPHRLSSGATKVLVQTDCQAAIDWIEKKHCVQHPAVLEHVLATAEKYGVQIQMRHIKAHTGTTEPRTYCHDWCDREARRIARLQHRERGGPLKGPAKKRRKRPKAPKNPS